MKMYGLLSVVLLTSMICSCNCDKKENTSQALNDEKAQAKNDKTKWIQLLNKKEKLKKITNLPIFFQKKLYFLKKIQPPKQIKKLIQKQIKMEKEKKRKEEARKKAEKKRQEVFTNFKNKIERVKNKINQENAEKELKLKKIDIPSEKYLTRDFKENVKEYQEELFNIAYDVIHRVETLKKENIPLEDEEKKLLSNIGQEELFDEIIQVIKIIPEKFSFTTTTITKGILGLGIGAKTIKHTHIIKPRLPIAILNIELLKALQIETPEDLAQAIHNILDNANISREEKFNYFNTLYINEKIVTRLKMLSNINYLKNLQTKFRMIKIYLGPNSTELPYLSLSQILQFTLNVYAQTITDNKKNVSNVENIAQALLAILEFSKTPQEAHDAIRQGAPTGKKATDPKATIGTKNIEYSKLLNIAYQQIRNKLKNDTFDKLLKGIGFNKTTPGDAFRKGIDIEKPFKKLKLFPPGTKQYYVGGAKKATIQNKDFPDKVKKLKADLIKAKVIKKPMRKAPPPPTKKDPLGITKLTKELKTFVETIGPKGLQGTLDTLSQKLAP